MENSYVRLSNVDKVQKHQKCKSLSCSQGTLAAWEERHPHTRDLVPRSEARAPCLPGRITSTLFWRVMHEQLVLDRD